MTPESTLDTQTFREVKSSWLLNIETVAFAVHVFLWE